MKRRKTPCAGPRRPSCPGYEKTLPLPVARPADHDDAIDVRGLGDGFPPLMDDGPGNVLGGRISANGDGKGGGGAKIDGGGARWRRAYRRPGTVRHPRSG